MPNCRRDIESRDLAGRVELRAGVPVAQVGDFLRSCHALLVPLRDHALLEDFIPSKLYDAMAVGRPVLVAARGEAAALTEASPAPASSSRPRTATALAAAARAAGCRPGGGRERLARGRKAGGGGAGALRQVDHLERVLVEAAQAR